MIAFFLALLVHLFLHVDYYQDITSRESSFSGQGQLMMTSSDGYGYLRLARTYVDEGQTPADVIRSGESVLPAVAGEVHKLTGWPLESVAFFLSPALASLMCLAVVLFACAMNRPWMAVVAAVAQSASPYWFARTRAGYFDTDPLIPLFVVLGVLCVYMLVRGTSARRWLWGVGVLALSWLSNLWWPQVPHVVLAFACAAYVATVFVPSGRMERVAKLALGLGGVALLVVLVLDLPLPGGTSETIDTLRPHFRLAVPTAGNSLPQIHVGELNQLVSMDSIRYVNGSYLAFAASLIGFGLLFMKDRVAFLALAPLIGMGFASVFAVRFLVLFIPAYSIGLGFFLSEIVEWSIFRAVLVRKELRVALAVLAAVVMLAPSYAFVTANKLPPMFTSGHVQVARDIRNNTEPGAVIWASWSKGYFLRYYSQRNVMADGGTVDADHIFLLQYPLGVDNPELAANWIRFFGRNGLAGLQDLVTRLGDKRTAIEFARDVFVAPDDLDATLARFGQSDAAFWREYLFPAGEVDLFLDHILLNESSKWFRAAQWDFRSGTADVSGTRNFAFDDSRRKELYKGTLATAEYGRIWVFRDESWTNTLIDVRKKGLMIYLEGTGALHWADARYARSLTLRLLVQNPKDTERFTSVFYDPINGSLWRVEPRPATR